MCERATLCDSSAPHQRPGQRLATACFRQVDKVLCGMGVTQSTPRDRALLRETCVCVSTRAARLAAVALVGVSDRLPAAQSHSAACDGTVIERYPHFQVRTEMCFRSVGDAGQVQGG